MLQTDNKHEYSSAVNNVSADSLLAGSINSYRFLIINVHGDGRLAISIGPFNVFFFQTKQKTKYKSSTALFNFETR